MLAYFDCFAGISGDMTLSAFIDLGVPVDWLQGSIEKLPLTGFDISVTSISRKGIHASLERRVNVFLDVTLSDPAGKVLWSAKGLSANEAYNVMEDKQDTEQNRWDAIAVLSKRLAQRVYNGLTEDF